ncbi:ComEC family competence protein [Chitinophaga sedimenti]|uniref:ComEC/Rec2 family competence protein n=1 Tax=Chitinophaga sedimenti TaxID=2033606 RepID=UPI002004135C|nr:ComEC/Rec2 family competence protein [Chitinophaga sedimenti]MCK7558842.1 ComEC family competence protein [Chitinophaga sedimenti]
MGSLALYVYDARNGPGWLGGVLADSSVLQAVLLEPPVERAASWKVLARVQAQSVNGRQADCFGKVLLYFAKDSIDLQLQYGSRLLLYNKLQCVAAAGNPGAFDYRAYCARNNIFYQADLRSADWHLLAGNEGNWLMAALLRTKQYCLSLLRTYVRGEQASGLAQALLIGYREELERDIVQAYTNTGVVHIIAISGLHLGLIYVSLLWLLQWLPEKVWVNWTKVLIILMVLWGFSIITGASASVLRSAVMFTMIAIGQFLLARHTNIYNTLAASAFLLLCYNPYFIADVGFQLSYLAVLSILLFYKPIYACWELKWVWTDKLWQMVAVSLAAQLLTIPVCLYYFHQFPNLFLLANLVAVPLSTAILYGEIFLVIFGGVPLIVGWLGKAVEWGIMVMNFAVDWLNRLPFAVTDNLWMNGYEVMLLYGLTGCIAVWWLMKQKYAFFISVGVWLVLAAMHTGNQLRAQRQRLLIVYQLPRQKLVALVDGQRQQLIGDTLSAQQMNYSVRPVQMYYRLKNDSVAYRRLGNFIQFYHIRLVMIDGRDTYQLSSHKLKTDYILLSHNPHVSIRQLTQQFEFSAVIFDASNHAKRIQHWKNDCKALTLRSFSVPEQGAFVLNL